MNSSRLDTLVLARLACAGKSAPTPSEISRALVTWVGGRVAQRDLKEHIEASIARLKQRGDIDARRRLTDAGSATLGRVLGLSIAPKTTWSRVRSQLIAQALGGDADATNADRLRGAVIAKRFELGELSVSSRVAVDRLAWKRLGRDTKEPFTLARVQAWVLRDLAGEASRIAPERLRRQIATQAAGAKNTTTDALRAAVLADWLLAGTAADSSVEPAEAPHAEAPASAPSAPEPSPAVLADLVQRVARDPSVNRFHDDRAYIASVWEALSARGDIAMSLERFKERLVDAHRHGLVRIARADLVQAMDAAELERSEARYLDASFHFVAVEGGV